MVDTRASTVQGNAVKRKNLQLRHRMASGEGQRSFARFEAWAPVALTDRKPSTGTDVPYHICIVSRVMGRTQYDTKSSSGSSDSKTPVHDIVDFTVNKLPAGLGIRQSVDVSGVGDRRCDGHCSSQHDLRSSFQDYEGVAHAQG